jgi:hypothetical protein
LATAAALPASTAAAALSALATSGSLGSTEAAPGATGRSSTTRVDAGRTGNARTTNQRHFANGVLKTARDVVLAAQVDLLAAPLGAHLVFIRLEVLKVPSKKSDHLIEQLFRVEPTLKLQDFLYAQSTKD